MSPSHSEPSSTTTTGVDNLDISETNDSFGNTVIAVARTSTPEGSGNGSGNSTVLWESFDSLSEDTPSEENEDQASPVTLS